MCRAKLLPTRGISENFGWLMVRLNPIPPVSTTAWFGCFASSVPRRWAIMVSHFSRTGSWEDAAIRRRTLQVGQVLVPSCSLLVGVRKLQNFGLSPVGADDLQADRKSGLSEATWHGDRRKAAYIHRASIAQQGEFSRAKQIGIGF